MVVCPACGTENPDGVGACQRCGLAEGLFGALRAAAGVPESDPRYSEEIGQILESIDVGGPTVPSLPPSVKLPARFVTTAPPRPRPTPGEGGPSAPLTPLPALPAGHGAALWRRQIEEYLQLARRIGVDLRPFTDRVHEASLSADPASLEVLSRELFIHVASALTSAYEEALARREEIGRLTHSSTPDAEIESARSSLALGDLPGALRKLRRIDDLLTAIEDEWSTVQVLLVECDLLAETIRGLGGDPGPALGPLAEGRRIALEGKRREAEPVLARAALALWTVLNPLFLAELARIKATLLESRKAGADVAPAANHLRELAVELKSRNYGGAIGAYRRLKSVVDGPSVPAEPTTETAEPASAEPTPK